MMESTSYTLSLYIVHEKRFEKGVVQQIGTGNSSLINGAEEYQSSKISFPLCTESHVTVGFASEIAQLAVDVNMSEVSTGNQQ